MSMRAKASLRAVAAQEGKSVAQVKQDIQEAIDAAWADPRGRAAQEKLFPKGKPTPEEMIDTIAKVVYKQS